jgi:hypothetical protein
MQLTVLFSNKDYFTFVSSKSPKLYLVGFKQLVLSTIKSTILNCSWWDKILISCSNIKTLCTVMRLGCKSKDTPKLSILLVSSAWAVAYFVSKAPPLQRLCTVTFFFRVHSIYSLIEWKYKVIVLIFYFNRFYRISS